MCIGSTTVINPGVRISNAITVGSHSTVAKSLAEPGVYVNQPLRYLPLDYEESLNKYRKVNMSNPVEKIVQENDV